MMISVDELAQEIRRVDGRHELGAGVLAEVLMPFITARLREPAGVGGEVLRAARDVCAYDWSDNDEDAVEAIHRLRNAMEAAPQPPAEAQAQGGGEVFAWFRKQPRAWDVVKDSDLSERPAPGKMLAEGWTPVYTAPTSAPKTEENVAADSYHYMAEMLEPYVAREGSNPNGPLPASVVESFQMLLEHWKATQPPIAPVGVEGLVETWEKRAGELNDEGLYGCCAETYEQCAAQVRALAQQPAAVDGARHLVAGLVGLLQHVAVMGLESNYNGRPMADVVSEVIAAHSATEMQSALAGQQQGGRDDA